MSEQGPWLLAGSGWSDVGSACLSERHGKVKNCLVPDEGYFDLGALGSFHSRYVAFVGWVSPRNPPGPRLTSRTPVGCAALTHPTKDLSATRKAGTAISARRAGGL